MERVLRGLKRVVDAWFDLAIDCACPCRDRPAETDRAVEAGRVDDHRPPTDHGCRPQEPARPAEDGRDWPGRPRPDRDCRNRHGEQERPRERSEQERAGGQPPGITHHECLRHMEEMQRKHDIRCREVQKLMREWLEAEGRREEEECRRRVREACRWLDELDQEQPEGTPDTPGKK